MEYAYADDQASAISDGYSAFEKWLSDPHMLSAARIKGRLLTVKVAPENLWFLRFPLGLYMRLQLGRFSLYQALQWIVTRRTLAENATYRNGLTDALNDLGMLLDGTVIVINEYKSHFQEASKDLLLEGLELVGNLLRQYEEVYVDEKCFSLRWIGVMAGNSEKPIFEQAEDIQAFGTIENPPGVFCHLRNKLNITNRLLNFSDGHSPIP